MIIIKCGIYHLRNDDIQGDVISRYRSYNVRPLAFIFDAYVFSWFWDNMYALLVTIIILHVLNLYLIYKICEKMGIYLSAFCLCIFAVCPILVESIYCLSLAKSFRTSNSNELLMINKDFAELYLAYFYVFHQYIYY